MKDILKRSATAYQGPNGYVESETSNIHLELSTPVEMTKQQTSETNSFELVAVAYSACMSGAMNKALEMAETRVDDFAVSVTNHLKKDDDGGVRFEFELIVTLEGVNPAQKETIVNHAYSLCPFSNAIKGNVQTHITIK